MPTPTTKSAIPTTTVQRSARDLMAISTCLWQSPHVSGKERKCAALRSINGIPTPVTTEKWSCRWLHLLRSGNGAGSHSTATQPAMPPDVRKGMPLEKLIGTLPTRFLSRFVDTVFAPLRSELDAISDAQGTPDEYELSVDWLAARDAIKEAERRHNDPRE